MTDTRETVETAYGVDGWGPRRPVDAGLLTRGGGDRFVLALGGSLRWLVCGLAMISCGPRAAVTSGDDASGSDTGAVADLGGPTSLAPRRLVTADWLDGRLSVLDYEGFVTQGQSRDEALLAEIDLSAYAPGPLELAVTPDGRRAVVTAGPGFFQGGVGALIGAGEVPGGGAVLVVDLLTGEVLAELATPEPPMGVVITQDGDTAYTANYGDEDAPGQTVTQIDLVTLEVVGSVLVGARPEQLALMGELLAVNAASDGTVVVLDTTANPPIVLGAALTSSDPSYPLWMEEFPDQVLMTDSQGPGGVSLVDLTTPAMPASLTQLEVEGIPYAIDRVEDALEVVVLATRFTSVDLHRLTVGAFELVSSGPPVSVAVGGFPLGVHVADNKAVFAVPGDALVVVVDLEDGQTSVHPWPSEPGPTFVAEAPAIDP